jgi:hypothetical protein
MVFEGDWQSFSRARLEPDSGKLVDATETIFGWQR